MTDQENIKILTIGDAARAAANIMIGGSDWAGAADTLFAEDQAMAGHFSQHAARFVVSAGAVSGEAVFRWSCARKLHLLDDEPWDVLSSDMQTWFDVFARVAHALTPAAPAVRAIVPAPEAARAPAPAPAAVDTSAVLVVLNAPAPTTPTAPAAVPGAIGPATLARWERGAPPSPDELAAMTPEERRGFAALMGMPGAADLEFEAQHGSLGAAPDVDPASVEVMAIDKIVGGEAVTGAVTVAKTRAKPK